MILISSIYELSILNIEKVIYLFHQKKKIIKRINNFIKKKKKIKFKNN